MMASVASIYLNSQIIIANRWFSDKERAMAMSVLNVSKPVGQVISFTLTGSAFAKIDDADEQDSAVIESIKQLIMT